MVAGRDSTLVMSMFLNAKHDAILKRAPGRLRRASATEALLRPLPLLCWRFVPTTTFPAVAVASDAIFKGSIRLSAAGKDVEPVAAVDAPGERFAMTMYLV